MNGLTAKPSAATGTVMRPDDLREYATKPGFSIGSVGSADARATTGAAFAAERLAVALYGVALDLDQAAVASGIGRPRRLHERGR